MNLNDVLYIYCQLFKLKEAKETLQSATAGEGGAPCGEDHGHSADLSRLPSVMFYLGV